MGKATVIPFGPQHPVLPEPLHLDLVVEDETVIEAVPQIGFIHRGLEKLVETRDYNQFIYVAERICGICAFGHSMGYAETVEKLMGVEIPTRAEYLRVIWHELSRIHSHVLWMGLAADDKIANLDPEKAAKVKAALEAKAAREAAKAEKEGE